MWNEKCSEFENLAAQRNKTKIHTRIHIIYMCWNKKLLKNCKCIIHTYKCVCSIVHTTL